MDRRRFLQVGAAALATAVAGCGLRTGAETASEGDGALATPSTAGNAETPDESNETPTAEPTPRTTETETATPTATATPPEAAQVVAVADGNRTFAPQVFEIETGETVAWVWHNSGHNVRATARPRGSDFTGTAGDDEDLYDEGHVFSHTFEVAGDYEYHCYPHRNVGMTGSFTVTE